MTAKPSYVVRFQPYTEGYWVASCEPAPKQSAVTQGATFEESQTRIREALALLLDVPEDSFEIVGEVAEERSDDDEIEALVLARQRLDQVEGGLVLWHRTTDEAAASILSGGFRDARGFILVGVAREFEGVFVSNTPLDSNEGAKGDALLRIVLDASEEQLAAFEVVEEAKTYREWLVPAVLLNSRGRLELATEDDDG